MEIEKGYELKDENITHNPNDDFYRDFLKDYYVKTADGQYLFGSKQPGRRPDRVFHMAPEGHKLGYKQKEFDVEIGKKIFEIALRYLKEVKVIVLEGMQGEASYETGVRVILSIERPQSAYIVWMGKKMIFPPKNNMHIHCWNYQIPERLPDEYVKKIKAVWSEYDADEPLTLYDFTEEDQDKRRVLGLGVDYFGGAFKKPNLTMVWNRGEAEGFISYHAGCTKDRILKGLSGTGKTTLTVGPKLEQDDACLGKPIYEGEKIVGVELIGLEAASYAKSQGLDEKSPEWVGLMKSKDGKTIVLAQNIDCEGVEYVVEDDVKIPRGEAGHLQCTQYEKSGTTNGRFIFGFNEVNPGWNKRKEKKLLKTITLSFKRFDVLEPAFRVTNPIMAVALDSACESIITSAVAGRKAGTRVRSYAATDFMSREQSEQALLKLKMYNDLGLEDKLMFFINNAGFVGDSKLDGDQQKKGEKIKVEDSKRLIDLIEHRKIKNWVKHPVYGYLIPEPKELEDVHGMKDFKKRFNLLNYYTADEILEFAKRDIKERTEFLEEVFKGQEGYDKLKAVREVWKNCKLPSVEEIKAFYDKHYA
ncbi:MAG: phosphoenolpyruvate carboxykinase (ATP) [archaeon]